MKKRVISIIFVVLFLFLAFWFVRCLIVHRDAGDKDNIVSVEDVDKDNLVSIKDVDDTSKVKTFDELMAENQALIKENEKLKKENEEMKELKAMIEDEENCHGLCELHCPCQHKETRKEESGDWEWTPVATSNICRQGKRTVKVICVKCGEVVDEMTEERVDIVHNYNGQSTCPDCGFANPDVTPSQPSAPSTPSKPSTPSQPSTPSPAPSCKHCNTTTEYGDWVKKNIGTAAVCREATRTVKVICKDCGKVISETTETVKDEEHCGNPCTDCGYTTGGNGGGGTTNPPVNEPCTHPSTRTEAGSWSWSTVGSASCCKQGTREIRHICTKCGVVVRVETETDSTGHSFSGRVCGGCGYEKPLTDGYGEAPGEVPPPKNEWEEEDDGEIPNPVDLEP